MKLKFYLFLMSLVGLSGFNAAAQNTLHKRAMGAIGNTPKAGDFLNGASLENVDMTTGTLKIGIPLYEIKVNDISVPIMLNYSALGIKVGQEGGLPGMGWELSAGGKIITNVNGKADDGDENVVGRKSLQYNVQDGLQAPPPFTLEYFSTSENMNKLRKIINGKWDSAWDTYTYVLPNKSGSYVTDYSHDGVTAPYDPMVKIRHIQHGTNEHTITTDGLVYSFVPGDTKVTTKIVPLFNPSGIWNGGLDSSNSDPEYKNYDLYAIKSSRFNDVVNFQYDSFTESQVSAKSRTSVTESLPVYKEVTNYFFNLDYSQWLNPYGTYEIREPLISKSKTKYQNYNRIKEINFPTGKVSFEYSGFDAHGRDNLSNIKIYKKEGDAYSMIKRYAFVYKTNGAYLSYARYLDSIRIHDGDNTQHGAWKFDYQNGPLPVAPDSQSKAQDRWGFYNGASQNLTLLHHPGNDWAHNLIGVGGATAPGPLKYTRDENKAYYGPGTEYDFWRTEDIYNFGDQSTTKAINFAYRDYSFNEAIKGTLTSVKTPTGATYEYEYEPHKYNFNGYPTDGGGIRIASITKKLGHNSLYYGMSTSESTVRKYYTYGSATENYAQADELQENGMGDITVPRTVLNSTSLYHYPGTSNEYRKVTNFLQLSHPINNIYAYNGSCVMYKSVSEYVLQAGNLVDSLSHYTRGKTVYFNRLPLFDPYLRDYSSQGLLGLPVQGTNPAQDPNPGGNPVVSPYAYAGNVNASNFTPLYYSTDPGLSLETGDGTYAIHKYAYRDNAYLGNKYQRVETTNYYYKYYLNPDIASLPPINTMFAAATGQIIGPIPGNVPQLASPRVPPVIGNFGGGGNGLSNLSADGMNGIVHGSLNYFTGCLIMDEDKLPLYPGKYDITTYNLNNFSYAKKLVHEMKQEFSLDGEVSNLINTRYSYANRHHMMPTTIDISPKDHILVLYGNPVMQEYTQQRIYYAEDLADSLSTNIPALPQMKEYMTGLDQPLAEFTYRKKQGIAGEWLTGGTLNTLKQSSTGAFVPDHTYKLTIPDNYLSYRPSVVGFWQGDTINSNPAYFKKVMSHDSYYKGQVHVYTEPSGQSTTVLWGYNNQYPIAKVTNSRKYLLDGNLQPNGTLNAAVAYTSFETRDTCNWIYNFSGMVADTTAISGKQAFNIGSYPIYKQNVSVSGKHTLSYWYKSGSVINVTGATVSAEVVKNTLGPWVYAERAISNISGTLTITGSASSRIDELRLYPADAQMTTYIHDPLVGLSASFDSNSKPSYYKYDSMQRLMEVKDQDRNTIKAYKYFLGTEN
jgi:hypothetical protein